MAIHGAGLTLCVSMARLGAVPAVPQPRARGDEFEQGDQQHHDVVKVPPAMTADEELRPAGEKLDEHLDGHPSYEGPPNLHTHVEDVVKPFLALSFV